MGWNSQQHWEEKFGVTTQNLTSYRAWDEWHTDSRVYPAVVERKGRCQLALVSPEGISGAVSHESHVPRSHFNQGVNRRNKWRATMDFDPRVRYKPRHGHAAIFMRVHNDRTYWDPMKGKWSKGATRFGCFVRGEREESALQGAIQLDGDKQRSNPNEKLEAKRELVRFGLSEDPFSNTSGDIYRVEIIEEELYIPPRQEWVTQWQAKVYNLKNGDEIGESVVRTELYLEQQGMVIPSLDHSKLAIGSGPAHQGRVDATLIATNYWIY